MPAALVIGSSDGIGLALVRALLGRGFRVAGLSRSALPPGRLGVGSEPGSDVAAGYRHVVADVRDPAYRDHLSEICRELGSVDVCVYCAGVGEPLNLDQVAGTGRLEDSEIFEVNLLGLVRTIEVVLPGMLARASGHVIGLSSLADSFPDPTAPSYGASKAGVSAYLERLGLAVRPRGVFVTSVRFGFVDTKMAKADVRPFIITPEAAAGHILRCMERRPRRYSHPRIMAALLWVIAWPNRLRLLFG
ncbi:MAG TPA: SDR family NAD(P)-dependent oxidoreductase [Haliangium sp.]|nr:SDR family NAD(P)-dependent oxidoreductase [Haliangium sp.]